MSCTSCSTSNGPLNQGRPHRLKTSEALTDTPPMAFQLPEDRKTAITDPVLIRAMVTALITSREEFPIKVEGTSTLPYTSHVAEANVDRGWWDLKLQRALPPELAKGAIFRATLAYEGQRFEGLMSLKGREGYLRYQFHLPKEVFLADRRIHKRYAYRPRENVFVTLTDGRKAASGPLASLCVGGLGFRADRIVDLESHARLPMDTIHLQQGAGFLVKVQDLPKAPMLELRGKVAYTFESPGGLLVGVDFTGISDAAQIALEAAIKFKEMLSRGVASVLEPKAAAPGATASAPAGKAGPAAAPEEQPGPANPLLRLRRRAVPLALLMPEGEARERLRSALATEGYWRLITGASGPVLQTTGRMILGLEEDCVGLEGSLPFDHDEQPGHLARRIDSVMGLKE